MQGDITLKAAVDISGSEIEELKRLHPESSLLRMLIVQPQGAGVFVQPCCCRSHEMELPAGGLTVGQIIACFHEGGRDNHLYCEIDTRWSFLALTPPADWVHIRKDHANMCGWDVLDFQIGGRQSVASRYVAHEI
jgi:hypothetical protein